LTDVLDRFGQHYNGERPHQGIGNATPAERYLPGRAPGLRLRELALAAEEPRPHYPRHSVLRKVWGNGVVTYDGMGITLGKRYAGATVRILEIGELVHVYLGDELLRALAPDRSKRYQKLGKNRARRH
jgi:hypothetical protein